MRVCVCVSFSVNVFFAQAWNVRVITRALENQWSGNAESEIEESEEKCWAAAIVARIDSQWLSREEVPGRAR